MEKAAIASVLVNVLMDLVFVLSEAGFRCRMDSKIISLDIDP